MTPDPYTTYLDALRRIYESSEAERASTKGPAPGKRKSAVLAALLSEGGLWKL